MAAWWTEKILDTYTYLDYKKDFSAPSQALNSYMAPGWVPPSDRRRLEAYKIYDAYYRTAARLWRDPDMSDEDRVGLREYGDPRVLVETALSSLLGEEFHIAVEGATLEGVDDPTNTQHFMDDWADKENFYLKVWECERNACKLGDGVYVLGYDPKVKRVRCSVWDPGMFFPDLNEQHLRPDEFPPLVNIVYEYETRLPNGDIKQYVRRIQWQMLELEGVYTPAYPGAEPTAENCQFSDGIWDITEVGRDSDVLNFGRVSQWLTEPVMLDIDFIPVVHVPCFTAECEFWSVPVHAGVMQLFDDLVNIDTDGQKAAATSASPAVAVSGVMAHGGSGDISVYGPGQLIEVGDGTASVIDTSEGVTALGVARDGLLERLSVNGRTPEALLGRVKPNEVPSGIALALGFSQHTNMVREMRSVRWHKYRLLFKFLQKYSNVVGNPVALVKSSLTFGSYLPSDKEQATEHVVQLLNAKAISLETAVAILLEAGFPIEDATMEVERIRGQDLDAALKLSDLDLNAGRERAGLSPIGNGDMPVGQMPVPGGPDDFFGE